MSINLLRKKIGAFSLLEILIALGLLGVIVFSLLSLFPAALRSEKESEEETRATLIASGMMETLVAPDGVGKLRLATGMSNGIPVLATITLGSETNFLVAYNASCQPMQKLTSDEAVAPLHNPEAVAVASLSFFKKAALPGMITAEITISAPASAPESGRSSQRFVRLLATPYQ